MMQVSRRDLAGRPLPDCQVGELDQLPEAAGRVAAAWSEVGGLDSSCGRGAVWPSIFVLVGTGGSCPQRQSPLPRPGRRLLGCAPGLPAPREEARVHGAGSYCLELKQPFARSSEGMGSFGDLLPEPLLPSLHSKSFPLVPHLSLHVRLPANLLSRPYLADYLQHLQRSSMSAEFCEPDQDPEALEPLHSPNEGPQGQDSYQEILQQAAGVGAIHVVRNLLKRSDHASAQRARTPLHAACMNGRSEVVRLLLEARVAATCGDGAGVQPVHLAAQGGSEQVLTMLLAARAKADATTDDKQTALHWAARSGAPGAVLNLLLVADAANVARKARASKTAGTKVDAAGSECFLIAWNLLLPRRAPVNDITAQSQIHARA